LCAIKIKWKWGGNDQGMIAFKKSILDEMKTVGKTRESGLRRPKREQWEDDRTDPNSLVTHDCKHGGGVEAKTLLEMRWMQNMKKTGARQFSE